jgi:hypothetical protein
METVQIDTLVVYRMETKIYSLFNIFHLLQFRRVTVLSMLFIGLVGI